MLWMYLGIKVVFKCEVCKTTLTMKNFKSSSISGKPRPYCNVHYPKEKGTQVANSFQVKSALNAPKLKMSSGIQKDKRTTFGPGELQSPSSPNWTSAAKPLSSNPARGSLTIGKQEEKEVQVQNVQPEIIQEVIVVEVVEVIEQTPPTQVIQQTPPPTQVSLTKIDSKWINLVSKMVPFIDVSEETEMTTFFDMWKESFCDLDFKQIRISTSSSLNEIRWESSGSEVLLEPMISFFTEIGALNSEMDNLRKTVKSNHPTSIGSWIDMSLKDGMDAGWKMEVSGDVAAPLQSIDGEPANKIDAWAKKNNIKYHTIARDVGESPPRPSEVRFQLGNDGKDKCLSAWKDFGFPEMPLEYLQFLNSAGNYELIVVATADSFIRLGISIVPVDKKIIEDLCAVGSLNSNSIFKFSAAAGKEYPDLVEFQHLKRGYNVFKEGFEFRFIYLN